MRALRGMSARKRWLSSPLPTPSFLNLPPRSTRLAEMRYHLLDRTNHVFHVRIAHAMEHGQADQPLVGILRHRILAAPVTEALAVVGMAMHRNVMHVDP